MYSDSFYSCFDILIKGKFESYITRVNYMFLFPIRLNPPGKSPAILRTMSDIFGLMTMPKRVLIYRTRKERGER